VNEQKLVFAELISYNMIFHFAYFKVYFSIKTWYFELRKW